MDGWVIDAQACPDGMAAIIPYKGDLSSSDCEFITGLTMITSVEDARAKASAIVHFDGPAAVERFLLQRPEFAPKADKKQWRDGMAKRGETVQSKLPRKPKRVKSRVKSRVKMADTEAGPDGVVDSRARHPNEIDGQALDSIFGPIIEDGFGNAWPAICPQCGGLTMQIVRPGKAQCGNCG
jgi:hypothetical protein